MRWSLIVSLVGLVGVSSCSVDPPPKFSCSVDDDCELGHRCLSQVCIPVDPCAAGIYVGDELPTEPDDRGEYPEGTLVRQVAGSGLGVSASRGALTVEVGAEPKLFAVDFYDDPNKNAFRAGLGVFVEARLQVEGDSAPCAAVLRLWPDRRSRAAICIGAGRIGVELGRGQTNALVDSVDIQQRHTYRLSVVPDPNDFDAGVSEPTIELHIDDERVLRLSPTDFVQVEVDERSDRAPVLEFGGTGPGTVRWDFVRWGCDPQAGVCVPSRQEDDVECTTGRRNTVCGGAAVAQERCDGRDDDCDGHVDEDFQREFPGSSLYAAFIAGDDRYLGESCGLPAPCSAAVVRCADDGRGLTCDVSDLKRPERCDNLDNDCDALVDEDFTQGAANASRLYSDPILGEVALGLGEPCGSGTCADGAVVCNPAQDGLTCSTLANRLASDVCNDGRDNDCDGSVDEGADLDGDGFGRCERCLREGEDCVIPHDCDDTPETGVAVNPAAFEICNRVDDDCDGLIDEGLDLDGDGFLVCGQTNPNNPDEVINRDCRDDPAEDQAGQPRAWDVFPGADELCDGVDNDCNGIVDEDFSFENGGRRFYSDRNHCGRCGVDCDAISAEMNTVARCEIAENDSPIPQYQCSPRCQAGFVDSNADLLLSEPDWHEDADGCDCEVDPAIFCDDPAGINCSERCDGRDNDCDGVTDEDFDLQLPTCYTGPPGTRNVGICREGRESCFGGEVGPDRCIGEVTPFAAVERSCDGLDEDCDGRVDEGDLDDGTACDTGAEGICGPGVMRCVDGAQACVGAVEHDEVSETCDLIDNDCDGRVDEDTDFDGDGFSSCRSCREGEAPLDGAAWCTLDCDDRPVAGRPVHPGAREACNAIDDDCDGYFDEEFVVTNGRALPIDREGQVVFGTAEGLIYNRVEHCGGCGEVCALPNGFTDCSDGACGLAGCRNGFSDRDGDPANGCEVME